ncbi:transport and Golgi organization protein 1 homolog [Salvelinus namaycush]|uniref:Transport and Golgi organization protein 1 homolog n=1 Tax=Salvelinus namaycush TaxID=8040 RepID=A0A8U0QFR9_SALNM|nr:transport and Golgi organization protein 1 homolog [Salvelinus namaycush]XP_038840747.1 transport and Golgi organization protein 1 homolog [Salvelinus namaycush]XP_038842893.1 transport and Golgi organization protein 1 homolog [Salvelinus namaycush]XP_038842894.1 transport and Golgi organization protein 1 homolog [Salvelinus namaycush]
MVTSLPEHWKPGPDFYGVSCEPVLVTAGAGVFGFLFWRSILSVKSKSYLKMVDRMKKLEQEKEIIQKVAKLQQQGEELKEKQKLSENSATLSLEKIQELENIVQEMERQNEHLDLKSLLSHSILLYFTFKVFHIFFTSKVGKIPFQTFSAAGLFTFFSTIIL